MLEHIAIDDDDVQKVEPTPAELKQKALEDEAVRVLTCPKAVEDFKRLPYHEFI